MKNIISNVLGQYIIINSVWLIFLNLIAYFRHIKRSGTIKMFSLKRLDYSDSMTFKYAYYTDAYLLNFPFTPHEYALK